VVEWSRSEPLQRTPLDTATGEGLPGLSTGAGCSNSWVSAGFCAIVTW
jgi:hypothetical protein